MNAYIEQRHGGSGMTDVILRTEDMRGLHGIVLCRYSLSDGNGCETEWPIRVIGGGMDWCQGKSDRGLSEAYLGRMLDELDRIVRNINVREYEGRAWDYRRHVADMIGNWKYDNWEV